MIYNNLIIVYTIIIVVAVVVLPVTFCVLYIYLGNHQHAFDNLSIVSHRQRLEIAAKEPERKKTRIMTGLMMTGITRRQHSLNV